MEHRLKSSPNVYPFGWPFTQGLNYFDQERLENYITELEVLGFDFHIHAIGNRGVEEALNAIEGARETNGDIGARHRITHIEMVNEEEYPRFAELNVVADAQVAANWTQPNQWSANEDFVSAELADNMIPIKSIYDAGGKITLSSDYDVSTMNPFRGMQNALTRAPQNLPSLEEIVKAYTINGAYVMRQEDVTGSLEVGKFADLICVNQNIFEIPNNQIFQTDVTMTMVNGEIVYQASGFPDFVLENNTTDASFSLYPNIVASQTNISLENYGFGNYLLQIYDAAGKLVEEVRFELNSNNFSYRLDVSNLAEGIHTAQLFNSDSIAIGSAKMIVSR